MPASALILAVSLVASAAALAALVSSKRAARREREALLEREERLTSLIEALPHGVMAIARDGTVSLANAAAHRLFGVEPPELLGRLCADPRWGLRERTRVQQALEPNPLARALRAGEALAGVECALAGNDGAARLLTVHATPLFDADGTVRLLVAELEDVTERRETERALQEASRRDPLTGLCNRGSFEEQLRRRTEERGPLALIVCDVDGLKLVNDTLGHRTGDEALRLAARVIQGCVPDAGVVARIGGDEFAVLLAGDLEAAETACRELRAAVERLDQRRETPYRLTLSIGATVSSGPHPDAAELFKRADDDMVQEKLRNRRGRTTPARDSAVDSRRRFGP